MTQTVTMPDGTVNNFPDEATPEMISHALGLSPSSPDFSTRISQDIGERQQQAGNIVSDYQSGKLNSAGYLAGVASTGLGTIADIGKEAAQSAWQSLPSGITQRLDDTTSAIKNELAQTPEGVAVGIISPVAKTAYGQFAQQNPNIAQGLNLAGNVAQTLPAASATEELANIAKPAIGAAFDTSPMDLLRNTASGNPDVLPTSKAPEMTPQEKYTGKPPSGQQPIAQPTSGIRKFYPDILNAKQGLSDNTTAAYKLVSDLGAEFDPETSQNAFDTISGYTNDKSGGLHRDLQPQTMATLNVFEKKAADGLSVDDIEGTRKKLGRIAYDSNASEEDKYAARQARGAIDDFWNKVIQNPDMMQNGSPEVVDALKQARAASSLELNHENVADIIRKGTGNWVKIENGFRKLYDDEDAFNRFSPEDKATIDYIAHPQKMQKALEAVGHMGFMGRGNWMPVGETIASFYNPMVAIPIAVGTGANFIRGNLVRKGADELLRRMEARSMSVEPVKPPLALPYYPKEPPVMSVSGSGQIISMTPELRQTLGQSPSTIAEQTPADVLRTNEAAANAQSELLRQYGNKRIMGNENIVPPHYPNTNPGALGMAALSKAQREADIKKTAEMQKIKPRTIQQDYTEATEPYIETEMARKLREAGFKSGGSINTNPSRAQIKAGNYKKDHINLHGLNISIENPKGSIRSGKDKGGKPWRVKMPADYGYIKGTVGADKEHIDCYVGPNRDNKRIWVIDQKHHDTGKFDEHKIMLGFKNKGQALATYRKAFSDGKADNRIQAITECTLDELKNWLKTTKKDAA